MAFRMFYFGDDDVLEMKKKELEANKLQYDSAISLVTSTVKSLQTLGESITREIEEIDQYTAQLKETKDELSKMKQKNDKVAANFSALLGE